MAFFIIQTHNWSWGLRHRLPGVREGKDAPESVHLFSVLGGNVRQSYFPIMGGGGGDLDHVEVGLDQRQPQRAETVPEGTEDLCLATEDWSSSEKDDTYLDLTLCLLLSACFLDLEHAIRDSSDSSVYWSEADLGSTSCFLWECFLTEAFLEGSSVGLEGWSDTTLWSAPRWGRSAGPQSTSICSTFEVVRGCLGGVGPDWQQH